MDVVAWLTKVGATDVDTVGGKAASLGELSSHGLPISSGFTVTANSYRQFITEAGIAADLFDVDTHGSQALAETEQRARDLILESARE